MAILCPAWKPHSISAVRHTATMPGWTLALAKTSFRTAAANATAPISLAVLAGCTVAHSGKQQSCAHAEASAVPHQQTSDAVKTADEFVRSKYSTLTLVSHKGWKLWTERFIWNLIDGSWLWLIAATFSSCGWQLAVNVTLNASLFIVATGTLLGAQLLTPTGVANSLPSSAWLTRQLFDVLQSGVWTDPLKLLPDKPLLAALPNDIEAQCKKHCNDLRWRLVSVTQVGRSIYAAFEADLVWELPLSVLDKEDSSSAPPSACVARAIVCCPNSPACLFGKELRPPPLTAPGEGVVTRLRVDGQTPLLLLAGVSSVHGDMLTAIDHVSAICCSCLRSYRIQNSKFCLDLYH